MKRATDIIVKARTANGAETTVTINDGIYKAIIQQKNLQLNKKLFLLTRRFRYIYNFEMVENYNMK